MCYILKYTKILIIIESINYRFENNFMKYIFRVKNKNYFVYIYIVFSIYLYWVMILICIYKNNILMIHLKNKLIRIFIKILFKKSLNKV